MKTIQQINKRSEGYSKSLARTITLHDKSKQVLNSFFQFLWRTLDAFIRFSDKAWEVLMAVLKNLAGKRVVNLQAKHKDFLEREIKARYRAKVLYGNLMHRMASEAELLEDKVKNA